MLTGKRSDHSLEFELLRLCARTVLDVRSAEQIKKHLQDEDLSWPLLIQLSQYHIVYPLLYQSLSTVAADGVPPEILQQLRQWYLATGARNLFFTQELKRILDILESNEIPLIAFKGPVLAVVAYKTLGLRPCTDLDILVPRTEFAEVEEILLENGYHPSAKIQKLSRARKALHLYLAQQQPYVRSQSLSLDVHLQIMPPGYHYNVTFETLLSRAQQVSVANVELCSFEPEDLLQILSYHGAKNRWERLKYICDVAELIRANPDLDWDIVLKRAQNTRGTRILYLSLNLGRRLLDVFLPPEVLKRISADKQVEKLSSWVLGRLPEQMQMGIASYTERVAFHLRLQDKTIDKVRYGLYSLLRQFDD